MSQAGRHDDGAPALSRGSAGWQAALRLQRVAARAWPAKTIVLHRGMILRFTGGASRRANSAAVYACDPDLTALEAIEAAEAFYGARKRAPRFQVGPTAPEDLDGTLAARGYDREAPICAQTAPLASVHASTAGGAASAVVEIAAAPSEAWVDIEVTRGRFADIGATFLALMAGLGARAAFAVARVAGEAAGACLWVEDDGLLVLEALHVSPRWRRGGVARALLHAGARWGLARGASELFLEVEKDNAAALRLYAGAGLKTRYEAHYRAASAEGGDTVGGGR